MPKARVLIIDDDPMVTQLLHEHLTNEGFEVDEVHMAEEGFDLAVKSPPQLILLDVMLPDATGFQMLGRLRQNPSTHSIPIIMMSGTARNANQLAIGKDMGADGYVVKPFNVIEVGEQVHNLIHTHPVHKMIPLAPLIEPREETEVAPEEEPASSDREMSHEVPPVTHSGFPAQVQPLSPVAAPLAPFKFTWKFILFGFLAAVAWAVLVGFIVAWILTSRGYLRPLPPTSPKSHQTRF